MAFHVDVVLSLSLVAGIVLVLVGVDVFRRWGHPGADALSVMLVLLGAIPTLAGVAAVVGTAQVGTTLFVSSWCLSTVAWFLFALQYTGTYTRRRVLHVVTLVAPSLFLVPWSLNPAGYDDASVFGALSAVILSSYSALALIGALLVVRSTVRYGHISLRKGGALVVVGVVPSLTVTLFGQSVDGAVTLGPAVTYSAGFIITAAAAGLAVYRYDIFSPLPAAGTIGERAMLRETDDVVAIVDMEDRLLSLNERARDAATDDARATLGSDIEGVLGHTTASFAESETVELDTDQGVRQFDSQVSTLTDYHGERLGAIVSLRDVTDREMRKQRLEVLNRILGHNIRNEVSVISANAEFVAEQVDTSLESHLATAIDAADSLNALGTKVRRIESILGQNGGTQTTFEPGAFLDTVADESQDQWPTATVRVTESTGDTDLRLECNRAVLRFALDNLVENAVEHAETETPQVELALRVERGDRYPVTVEVRDNGPGIPESEVDVLQRGTETPLEHGSGAGLWVTNWAVTDLGGMLSFTERGPDGGTIVQVGLPSSVLVE
jgi:signal transduction histidine kinase